MAAVAVVREAGADSGAGLLPAEEGLAVTAVPDALISTTAEQSPSPELTKDAEANEPLSILTEPALFRVEAVVGFIIRSCAKGAGEEGGVDRDSPDREG